MIASLSDLEALPVTIGPAEAAYAFANLGGASTAPALALLDDAERARASRFVRPADRDRFVNAHAALRLFLAKAVGRPPSTVRYVPGASGKPGLARSPGRPTVEFNLSHSGDVGLLAASRSGVVGADVERVRPVPDAADIAARYFARSEIESLLATPAGARMEAFFRCWTRKEAVIKALGEGLGRALDSFEVDLSEHPVAAPVTLDGAGDPPAVFLTHLAAPAGYAAAGVVITSRSAPVTRWRDISLT